MSAPIEAPLVVVENITTAMVDEATNSTSYTSATSTRASTSEPSPPGVEHSLNEADTSSLAAYVSDLSTVAWTTSDVYWRPPVSRLQGLATHRYTLSNVSRNIDAACLPHPDRVPPVRGPNIARSLAESHDINATVRAIAESMMQTLRTIRNSMCALGEAYIERTYI